ncbi:MAG: ABC transporter [Acidimicrobiia bacterium]|nr:ABC transporter [Acidimicrobiia bacterium]
MSTRASTRAVGRASLWSGPTLRVVEREVRVYRRLWRGSAFSTLGFPVLFLAALGIGVGGLVEEGTGRVEGLDYLDFVAPGMLAASVLLSAAGHSMWPVIAGAKWVGYYHATVSSPLTPASLHQGLVAWSVIQATGAAAVFLAIATLLGGVPSPWAPLTLPVAALLAGAIAAPLAAFAAGRDNDASFSVIMRLGVQPLFLFSGTFFPVANLPDSLEPVAWLSPLWHAVELCRAATTGAVDWPLVPAHVGVLVGLLLVGLRWGRRSFTTRLTP